MHFLALKSQFVQRLFNFLKDIYTLYNKKAEAEYH